MTNVLTRPGGRKLILVSTFVVHMQRLQFAYDEDFLCFWMIKLNKTIRSVLIYADTIKASLYFQIK